MQPPNIRANKNTAGRNLASGRNRTDLPRGELDPSNTFEQKHQERISGPICRQVRNEPLAEDLTRNIKGIHNPHQPDQFKG
jgi:hypothetical protein